MAPKEATTANSYLKARHYFRATYFPTNDSIVIEPLNAAVQSDKEWDQGTAWTASALSLIHISAFAATEDSPVFLVIQVDLVDDSSCCYPYIILRVDQETMITVLLASFEGLGDLFGIEIHFDTFTFAVLNILIKI